MHVAVLNLDRRPDRWQTMVDQLAHLGVEPIRWVGIDAGDTPTPHEHRLAICRSYAHHIPTITEITFILQDDVEIRRVPPPRDGVNVYNRSSRPDHCCPKAFTVTPDIAIDVGAAFATAEAACMLLPQLVKRYGGRIRPEVIE